MLALLFAVACYRPSDRYEVAVYGEGTVLDEVLPAPEPMGGQIEVARYRFWGTNLGHGLTGLWGDAPRADGTSVVLGYAFFGYPMDAAFDRTSGFLGAGPPVGADEDACLTRIDPGGYYSFMEYVDVGDHIAFSAEPGANGLPGRIRLERDPSVHHRPAGESWYVGYGGTLLPAVQDHALLPDTWRSGVEWTISFPGTLVPPDSTLGSVPYPLEDGALVFPPAVEGLAIGGRTVRPPHHGYDDDGTWLGDDAEDDVRFPGPWTEPLALAWTPSEEGTPLTVVLRYLGSSEEYACDCMSACPAGFTCTDGACVPDEGSGLVVLGEVVCSVADDGEFSFTPDLLDTLDAFVRRGEVRGAVLGAARIAEGTAQVADALTHNGKRVALAPVRTRAVDVVYTRLEAPE